MEFHLLQKFRQKLIGRELQQLDRYLAYFRVLCLWEMGKFLACDNKIDSYVKIAANKEGERIFYRRLILNTYRVILFAALTVACLFIIESEIIFSVLNALIIAISIYLFIVLVYSINKYTSRKFRLNYSIPFIIVNIVIIFSEIYYLNDIDNKLKAMVSDGSEKARDISARVEEIRKKQNLEETKAQKVVHTRLEGQRVLTSKRIILSCLELAAKYIEYYIPRKLKSGDAATDDLFKHSMQQVAAALRDKKMWLLTPMDGTYEQLSIKLIDILTKIVNDNWHDLERRELIKASRPTLTHIIIRSTLKILQTVLLGSLVLLFFLLFELISPFPINEAVQAIWLAGGFLWLGITILIKFDPDVATKFSLLKDTKSLLSSQDINLKQ